ncbi:MAG TPA: RusA family crossover junction endodeoxyribonuclease [Propionicimonas sp.]|jgi:crossover junction endodeoxyribonuclease RusA
MSILTCTMPGQPEQQGSKRSLGPGRPMLDDNKRLKPWRADAIAHLQQAMEAQGVEQFVGPVRVSVTFVYGRPKGHYGTGRNATVVKDAAPSWKATAPDADKLCRALGDALTQAGVVRDDALIVQWIAAKVWGHRPQTSLRIDDLSEISSV